MKLASKTMLCNKNMLKWSCLESEKYEYIQIFNSKEEVFMKYFDDYTRQTWYGFKKGTQFDQVKVSLDFVDQAEIQEVYLPLLEYIEISIDHIKSLNYKQQAYLEQDKHVEPFIIGVTGGVSVGKSTVAEILKELLAQVYPDKKVELINTDGFLYPNAYLEKHNLLERKGFPESYDMEALKSFINDVRQAKGVLSHPVYSHEIYDIVPGEAKVIDQPDILIVEGVVVLQSPDNPPLSSKDFLDFSIYVDAEFENVFKWFFERYRRIFDKVKDDPSNFYYEMSHWTEEEQTAFAKNIWATINTPNLENYIAPTKQRADIILHKGDNHYIDHIYVRRF